MTSAIVNVLDDGLVSAVRAADVLNGVDPGCGNWIKHYRPKPAEGEEGASVGVSLTINGHILLSKHCKCPAAFSSYY